MNDIKLAFIGAGNMAGAIIAGLIANGFNPKNIVVSNPSSEKLHFMTQKFAVQITEDNAEAAKNADAVLFCVKPQKIAEAVASVKQALAKNSLIISIAAGITTHFFEKNVSQTCAVVRAMPNITAMVSSGATGLSANKQANDAQKHLAESIFRAVGVVAWVEESKIDSITALSGSGPAYIFLVMEAMQKTAMEMGLSEEDSKIFTMQTVLGSAKLAFETGENFATLRASVTSPNGTTERALQVFSNANLPKIFADAMHAAKIRAAELSRG